MNIYEANISFCFYTLFLTFNLKKNIDMELSLKKLLNQPICVKFEFEWQKGYALSFFKDCDNYFRLDDADFMYLHFRNYNNCTFYSDEKGVSDNKRSIYPFADFFKLIV